jgi:hypothetical protein
MSKDVTTHDLLARIEKHEGECAIRWKNVESQLNRGGNIMNKLETRIYGFNAILLTGIIAILFKIV